MVISFLAYVLYSQSAATSDIVKCNVTCDGPASLERAHNSVRFEVAAADLPSVQGICKSIKPTTYLSITFSHVVVSNWLFRTLITHLTEA